MKYIRNDRNNSGSEILVGFYSLCGATTNPLSIFGVNNIIYELLATHTNICAVMAQFHTNMIVVEHKFGRGRMVGGLAASRPKISRYLFLSVPLSNYLTCSHDRDEMHAKLSHHRSH